MIAGRRSYYGTDEKYQVDAPATQPREKSIMLILPKSGRTPATGQSSQACLYPNSGSQDAARGQPQVPQFICNQRATCRAICIAAGATPGTGRPVGLLPRRRDHQCDTSGCPGKTQIAIHFNPSSAVQNSTPSFRQRMGPSHLRPRGYSPLR